MGRVALPPPPPVTACERCAAVCCRLTVVLQPDDDIQVELTTALADGSRVMAHGASGWCVALDHGQMNCGIYERRPQACRRFVMNGPYCRALRIDYRRDHERRIRARLE
jgi:Fe-S-cluster containining protein